MFRRCENPRNARYPNYGGRGIKVCAEWRSFEVFLRDMGECPPGLSLDRRDNNGDYEPTNCRWATREEQGRNKRNNRLLEHDGSVLPINAWAERLGLSRDVIRQRIDKLGWPVARALTTRTRPMTGQRPAE